MWWSNFRQTSPAAMAGTGGWAAPFSFTVSWSQGSLVEPKGARVWMYSEVHVLHVLWLSKKLQREKQNCACVQILHICLMHIKSLIDRCYFSILKIIHVSPYSGAMLHVSMRFVLLFDSLFTFWHFFPCFAAKKGCVQRCLLFRVARHRGRATIDPALPFQHTVGDRAVL